MKATAAFLFFLTIGISSFGFAEGNPRFRNLSYKPISVGEALIADNLAVPPNDREKVLPLGFKYDVTSPRDVSDGLADGKRMHGSLPVMTLDPQGSAAIRALLAAGKLAEGNRLFRQSLNRLIRQSRPVDVNAEVAFIVRKIISATDPEITYRLDEFADAMGELETNRYQVFSLEKKLAECALCSENFRQELSGKLQELRARTDTLRQKTRHQMTEAEMFLDSKPDLHRQVFEIFKSLDATADEVVNRRAVHLEAD